MTTAPCALRPLLTALVALLTAGLLFLAHSLRSSLVVEEDDLSRQALRKKELVEALHQAHDWVQERHRLVVEISEGRTPLAGAAARWMALHRRAPIDREKFREAHPGATDEERYCRALINMVTDLLSDQDPQLAQASRVRLERELDGLLRRGTLRPPEPALETGE